MDANLMPRDTIVTAQFVRSSRARNRLARTSRAMTKGRRCQDAMSDSFTGGRATR